MQTNPTWAAGLSDGMPKFIAQEGYGGCAEMRPPMRQPAHATVRPRNNARCALRHAALLTATTNVSQHLCFSHMTAGTDVGHRSQPVQGPAVAVGPPDSLHHDEVRLLREDRAGPVRVRDLSPCRTPAASSPALPKQIYPHCRPAPTANACGPARCSHVVPKPRDECSKSEQLGVSFLAGYIAGAISQTADFSFFFPAAACGATSRKPCDRGPTEPDFYNLLHRVPQACSAPWCRTRPTTW